MGLGLVEIKPRSFVYLLQPKPVAIIVSVDSFGKPNGMSAAWLTPTSRDPPLLAVAISPKRYTYELIKQTRDFTVNILDFSMIHESEFFGGYSGRAVDKFEKSKLTLVKSRIVKSPHIAEAVTALECSLYDEYPAGDHALVLGKVEKAYVREEAIEDDTYNLSKVKILLYLGGGKYTTTLDHSIT
ncbi:MAG: flavin reductase family protein [Nitrososphaerota archaeon]